MAREHVTATDADAPDRWALLWHGFFFAMLLAPTVLAVASAPSAEHAAVTVGIAGALGAWHWWIALHHKDWEGRLPSLLWFCGVLLGAWLLLGRDDVYLFLVYGLYPQVFWWLGRWAIPGVAVLTVGVFWRTGAFDRGSLSTWLVTVGGSVLLAAMVGLFVVALDRQSTARKLALEQLETTRAELAATARRAGVLEERQRIARELHDTAAQGFTGIVMQLEASDQALDTDPGRAREHLERARASARESLGELRRTAHEMRPDALQAAPLVEALPQIVRQWSTDSGVSATTSVEGAALALHPDVELALLRAAQEALANVAKHARASNVDVRLAYTATQVELSVADDGVGLDPSDRTDGFGLQGMRERMALVGGSLTVDSVADKGTTLVAAVGIS